MNTDLKLPLSAEKFIPHRPPMRLVDTLLEYGDNAGLVEAIVSPMGILTDPNGCLDEVAFVELLAQGYAVIKGFHDLLHGIEVSKGYLVGIKKMKVTGRADVGDRLHVRIRTIGSFEGFAVAEGEVERGDEIVASGTIKLWVVPPDKATEVGS